MIYDLRFMILQIINRKSAIENDNDGSRADDRRGQ